MWQMLHSLLGQYEPSSIVLFVFTIAGNRSEILSKQSLNSIYAKKSGVEWKATGGWRDTLLRREQKWSLCGGTFGTRHLALGTRKVAVEINGTIGGSGPGVALGGGTIPGPFTVGYSLYLANFDFFEHRAIYTFCHNDHFSELKMPVRLRRAVKIWHKKRATTLTIVLTV